MSYNNKRIKDLELELDDYINSEKISRKRIEGLRKKLKDLDRDYNTLNKRFLDLDLQNTFHKNMAHQSFDRIGEIRNKLSKCNQEKFEAVSLSEELIESMYSRMTLTFFLGTIFSSLFSFLIFI